jgi:glutathione S-transferase
VITLTAFKWVPPLAQGLARDLRVRWALEEAAVPYRVRLIDAADQSSPGYRCLQPFGQVPVLEDEELVLFESGAIVHYIAQQSETLLPGDAIEQARAVSWLFSALNSVEIVVQQLAEIDLFWAGQEWTRSRRPAVEERVRQRLRELADWIGDREHLEARFTAGDLMMTTVLRTLRHTSLVSDEPRLRAYQARCEARPAFRRALRDHMAAFAAFESTSREERPLPSTTPSSPEP